MSSIRRVLIVDDAPVFRDAIALTMRPHFGEVFTAATREEGIELLRQQPFDLVISDLVLPDGDGFEVLGASRRLACPPLAIMVTSWPSSGSRRMASRLGALAFLPKPIAFRDIARVLEHHGSWPWARFEFADWCPNPEAV